MLITRIQEKLQKYPLLIVDITTGFVRVHPQTDTGFMVWAQECASRYTVGFEGWHEEFTDVEESLNCFAFGLSTSYKLRVYRRGKTDYKWQVLHCVDDKWIIISETGLLFSPFWLKYVTRELQNNIINVE